MKTYVTIYQRALSGYGSHNGSSFAAAIAYNAIFSIFPLILLAIAFLGFFIHGAQQREHIVDALFGVLGAGVARDALRTQVDAVAGGSAAVGIVGIVVAAWSGTGVFDQIRASLQIVWNSTKPRPWFQERLIDFAMLLSVGLLILLSTAATGVLTALAHFSAQIFGGPIGAGARALFVLASFAVPALILFCAFSLLYWLVPHAEIRLKDIWLGALTAAVGFEAVQLLFAYYVANFGHYNQTYGTLGGIIAFLFFVYLGGNIILLGGEVAKEYIDATAGLEPMVAQPEEPQPKRSLQQRAWGAVKGLFVDTSPHHDTSVPYEPGRAEPMRPDARLLTDRESEAAIPRAHRSRGARRQSS